MEPKVSIIVPTYNTEKFIGGTLQSILNQTYTKFEVLIVDDCSKDRTLEVVRSFDDERLKVNVLKKNSGGPATPRNIGLSKAQGELISFLDSDDIWHPQKLEYQVKVMSEKNLKFVCSEKVKFGEDSEIKFAELSDQYNLKPIGFKKLLCKNFIPNSSVLIAKDLVEGLQFDQRKSIVAIEDYVFWLNILNDKNQVAMKIDKPLFFYRVSDSGISKSKLKMAKKIFNFYRTYSFNNRKLSFSKSLYYFITYIYYTLRAGN